MCPKPMPMMLPSPRIRLRILVIVVCDSYCGRLLAIRMVLMCRFDGLPASSFFGVLISRISWSVVSAMKAKSLPISSFVNDIISTSKVSP